METTIKRRQIYNLCKRLEKKLDDIQTELLNAEELIDSIFEYLEKE